MKQYEVANGVLCERVEECTMDCLAPGNPAEVHRPGCGLVPVCELVDVEETLQQYSDLVGVFQTLRGMLGMEPLETGRAAQDELLVAVEMLEQRFHDEHWEPGVITRPLAGTRRRTVDEELMMAVLGALRCIPDGKVEQGCTISDGARIKQWLHHAGRAAVETLKADRAWAGSALAALDVEQPGDLEVSALDAVTKHLQEIASGDAAWDFTSSASRQHFVDTGRWLRKGESQHA